MVMTETPEAAVKHQPGHGVTKRMVGIVPTTSSGTRHLSLSIASILGHRDDERHVYSLPSHGTGQDDPMDRNFVSPTGNESSRASISDSNVTESEDNDEMCEMDCGKADSTIESNDMSEDQSSGKPVVTSDNQRGTTDRPSPPSTARGGGNDVKQTPSYTAIIAQAILSSSDKKLPLGNIYDYISDNFPEFLKKGQGWRNCVRHNLSLSECFVKAGRARNGRGNYWGIHPRYIKNFSKGDFRKRRASHRPRNRDLTLGLTADRLHYPPFLTPFVLPTVLPRANIHRSFSVESILSPERGVSAFNTYKPWLHGKEEAPAFPYRMPSHCSQHAMWMEQKTTVPLHSHAHPAHSALPHNRSAQYTTSEHAIRQYEYYAKIHDYPSPPSNHQSLNAMKPACSCHLFCCAKP